MSVESNNASKKVKRRTTGEVTPRPAKARKSKPLIQSYIPSSPLPVYADALACLRYLATMKFLALQMRQDPLAPEPTVPIDRHLFTTADAARSYFELTEAVNYDKAATVLQRTNTAYLTRSALPCPHSFQAYLSKELGYRRVKIRKRIKEHYKFPFSSSISRVEAQRLQMQLDNARDFCKRIKIGRFKLTLGEVHKLACEAAQCLKTDSTGLINQALERAAHDLKALALDALADAHLATLFDDDKRPGRGQRLLSLFGYPSTAPATRGDLIGLPFGFSIVQAPKSKQRPQWAAESVTNSTVVTVKCSCGEGNPHKVTFYELQRGRALSCGCIRQKNITDIWLKTREAEAHNRFLKKHTDASRPDIDWRFWRESSFRQFVGLPWRPGLDVSRIGDDEAPVDYEPGTCFWEDAKENRKRAAKARKMRKLRQAEAQAKQALAEALGAPSPDLSATTLRADSKQSRKLKHNFWAEGDDGKPWHEAAFKL